MKHETDEYWTSHFGICLRCGGKIKRDAKGIGFHVSEGSFDHIPRFRQYLPKFGDHNSPESGWTLRECGVCGDEIYRDPESGVWDHCWHYLDAREYDHQARLEPTTKEEGKAYREKFRMMTAALSGGERKALGLTPIGHFIRAAK